MMSESCGCGVPQISLRPSNIVDILVWHATAKPALRSEFAVGSAADDLRRWADSCDADFATDDEGFFCVSRGRPAAEILAVDQSPMPHTYDLGILLGYPECCSRKMSELGEHAIDISAADAALWTFVPPFHRLNPAGYMRGVALISHVPCAPDCGPSLRIADAVRAYLEARPSCTHVVPIQEAGLLD